MAAYDLVTGAAHMQAREMQFELPGLRLAAREWGVEGDMPFVALHGWLDNAASFDRLAPELHGCHIVALDSAGHGQSASRSPDAGYGLWNEVGDVLEVVEALGWQRFGLLGHSRGAGIAMLFAGTFPERVERLVLVEGGIPLAGDAARAPETLAASIEQNRALREKSGRLFRDRATALAERANGFSPISIEAAELLAARSLHEVEGGFRWHADQRLKAKSELYLTRGQLRAFTRRIEARAIAFLASASPFAQRPAYREMLARVRGLEIVDLEGGHHLHMEDAVHEIAARTLAFLADEVLPERIDDASGETLGMLLEDGELKTRAGRAGVAMAALGLGACAAGSFGNAPPDEPRAARAAAGSAAYIVDAAWPRTLPNDWILGQVAGIAVDSRDHIWIVHRPRSITEDEAAAVQDPPTAECCVPAPSVIEFDPQGRLVRAWGGPRWDREAQAWVDPPYDWPETEHGIFVDDGGHVWIAGSGPDDHIVVKHDVSGRPLLTIGVVGETGGSNDTERLGQPADIAVDTAAGEVYVADGYGNRRIVVFDAETGAYERHWGAYGRAPSDAPLPAYDPEAPPSPTFRGPVHAVVVADDGLVYVADRTANRIQVFERSGRFVRERLIAPETLFAGAVWDIAETGSGEGARLFVADGHNKKIRVLARDDLEILGSFGRGGRQAGEFNWVHNVAVDSEGNVYTAEVNTGKRVQKFTPAAR